MKKLLLLLMLLAFCMQLSADERIRIIRGPYLQGVGTDQATIVWVTNKKAQSWVEIAPNDSLDFYAEARPQFYETLFGRKVSGTVHKVRVSGLQKGTTYRYRIFSKEILEEEPYRIIYGSVASSDVYSRKPLTFTTIDPEKPTVHFSVVNDIHSDNDKLRTLLSHVRKGETDFVLFNGDMTSHLDSENDLFEGFMNTAVKLFASETPIRYARGNHETRGTYALRFTDYFPTPTGKPYYAFRQGPVFFIVLDGGEDKPDNDIEYLGTAAFDLYREEQAAWLAEVTASKEFRSAPFRVAVIHVPPFGSTWHGPLHAQQMFVPILNQAETDLMLCGHLHSYQYFAPGQNSCTFPVLINSNKEVLDISATTTEMNVDVRDEAGKTTHSYTYKTHNR